MKLIRVYLLSCILFFTIIGFSQSGNVLIRSLDVDRVKGIVTVIYDLSPNEPNAFFDTEVSVILNLKTIKAKALSGDVGKHIQTGTNKMIVWDAKRDIGTVLEDDFIKVDIIAKRSSQIAKIKHNKNLYFGIGGVVAGGGLFLWGNSKKNESENFNEILEIFPNATDPYYENVLGKSRQEMEDEAEKSHNNAVILKAAAAAVAAAGVFLIIKHISNSKKDNQSVMIEPVIYSPGLQTYQYTSHAIYGARFTIRF